MLMVGFNRRFSPALTVVKRARRQPPRPAGRRIPAERRATSRSITGCTARRAAAATSARRATCTTCSGRWPARRPCRFRAASIDPATLPYRRNDNFSATIGYEDGSLAHLLYTSLGPKTRPGKERIEIFCDGETYIVDDFKRLIKASDGAVLWQSSEIDKGHYEELSRFGDAIACGRPSPIPFDELIETSAVALARRGSAVRPAGGNAGVMSPFVYVARGGEIGTFDDSRLDHTSERHRIILPRQVPIDEGIHSPRCSVTRHSAASSWKCPADVLRARS